jgi:GAF domain-containing protein
VTHSAGIESDRLLIDEQAALRRVATLVAEGVPRGELFSAVTREVARLFAGANPPLVASVIRFDPGPECVLVGASRPYEREPIGSRWEPKELYVSSRVLRDRRPARIDEADLDAVGGPDAEVLRLRRFLYQVGAPVFVEGRLWGAMTLNSAEALPPDTDGRLENFTELVATAIANAESRDALARLADEQAALRRVAMLVAEGATDEELFAAVADEVGRVLGIPRLMVARSDPDWHVTVLASVNEPTFVPGTRWLLDGTSVTATVVETGRSARIDDYTNVTGTIADGVRASRLGATAGVPIVVDGAVWGVIVVAVSEGEVLPADVEDRLSAFTDLVATAISNAESRNRIAQLADEQAALRRVAMLVAEGATSSVLCAAVTEEVSRVLGLQAVMLERYEPDGTTTMLASLNEPGLPVGIRLTLDGPSVSALVLETGRAARIDDYSTLPGSIAELVRDSGISATVGAPIIVDGAVWGVMTVGASHSDLLPPETDAQLTAFTGLVATAISNAASRDRLHTLAEEQSALRRVATLVAEGPSSGRLYSAVLEEVLHVLDLPAAWLVRYEPDEMITVLGSINDPAFPPGSRWPLDGESLSASLLETGHPVRVDDYTGLEGTIADQTRASGFLSAIGVPITVDGEVWGSICVGTTDPGPLPADTEARLADFTDLMATAISNAESRDRVRSLAEEQAALTRVATLVAEGAMPTEVFASVAHEVVWILNLSSSSVVQFESEDSSLVVASVGDPGFPAGSRWPLSGPSLNASVFSTGRPSRIDYTDLPGPVADAARVTGVRTGVGMPIVVDGSVWGMIAVGSRYEQDVVPADTETRLAAFTELVSTALSRAFAHEGLSRLATEQAALRRVATLVARAASPSEVFSAVSDEVSGLLGLPRIEMIRYGADGIVTVIGAVGDHPFPVGSRWAMDGPSVMAKVLETGRPARIDDFSALSGTVAEVARGAGFVSAIGAPIVVGGATWGAIIAISTMPDPIPEGAEVRLGQFTELVATAVSNLQAQDDLRSLAAEQTALRRVATLVAEGTDAQTVFDAVCVEAAQLFGASAASLSHYTADGFNVTMAGWSETGNSHLPVGTRLRLTPDTIGGMIIRTRAPARIDSWEGVSSEMAAVVRKLGTRSSVGAPVIVDGHVWGALVAATDKEEPMSSDTEVRLARFTDLIATAISNAATRAELIASRARIVAAGDDARRRIERNLHDGTQQRLIALGLDLRRIRAGVPDEARAGMDRMAEDLESIVADVRELSRGLHPPLLARGGLRPSLRALARRSPIPVEIDVELRERPPAAIETAVYYLVAEGLTNAIKHSEASVVSVAITADHAGGPFGIRLDGRGVVTNLHVTIADDGVGGAEPSVGSGLMGLLDRVDALGGRFSLESPPGNGTRISVVLPLEAPTRS